MTGIKKIERDAPHRSVLLQETVSALEIVSGNWYVDGTFGFGGHAKEMIRRGARVLGLDQDKQTLKQGYENFKNEIEQGLLRLEQANFRSLSEVVVRHNIIPSGILLDLGFSSWQLDESGRGFSFQRNEPLDMRMDPDNQAVKARDLVNGLYEKELAKLILSYGEDALAGQIAKRIVLRRKISPIENTVDLAQIIRDVYKHFYRSHSSTDPATKTFQALRIAVNDEINALKECLEACLNSLNVKGRIAVITFHGLEDSTVKKIFQSWEKEEKGSLYSKKPVLPTIEEIRQNPRSHSAKLRVFIKN